MKIGFTGTRKGMSKNQKEQFKLLLKLCLFGRSKNEFHHGKCKGADEQAHKIACDDIMDVDCIIVHPPKDRTHEGLHCKMTWYDVIELPRKSYLERDRDIVNDTDILIACPKNMNQIHSGTWYTINYAHKKGKPVIILW